MMTVDLDIYIIHENEVGSRKSSLGWLDDEDT